jgi:hypothetical protein
MKNLKSFLAIIMVLVIGACLTACQSAEEIAESERLVSESVSDSERIVSESISASESIAADEQKKVDNATFNEWFSSVKIDGIKFTLGSTKKYNILTFGPFGNTGAGYAPGKLTIYGNNQEITPEGLSFSVNTSQAIPVSALNYEFPVDVNSISPEKLVIKMVYKTDDNEKEPAKDVTLTYHFDI